MNDECRIQGGEQPERSGLRFPLRILRSAFCISQHRLWLAGGGVLLFLAVLAVGSHVANPRNSLLTGMAGDDLIPSYMAGTFVRQGHADRLMDFGEAAKFQAHLRHANGLEEHGRTGPWLNPPFYALVFVPLSALPYRTALLVWLTFNLLLLAGSVVLLCRMLPREDADGSRLGWRTWGLVPLLLVASMPFLQAMACQQNTFLSLAVLTATVTLWRAGRALPAGLACGLLLFKPQLAVLVAAVLVCGLGWRAAAGVAITGIGLLLLSAVTMPGALADYLHKLPALLPWLQPGRPYHWERQVTFQGFWRMLLQGPVTGPAPAAVRVLWPACALIAGLPVAVLGFRALRDRAGRTSPARRDRLTAGAVAAMPLVMPYFMDYDLLLLAVPATLFAADVCRNRCRAGRLDRLDRWTLAAWVSLFPLLFVNFEIAYQTRVSLTVPLLAGLCGLLLARAWRREEVAAFTETEQPVAPLRLAA